MFEPPIRKLKAVLIFGLMRQIYKFFSSEKVFLIYWGKDYHFNLCIFYREHFSLVFQTPNRHHINSVLTPIGELAYSSSCSLLISKVFRFSFPKSAVPTYFLGILSYPIHLAYKATKVSYSSCLPLVILGSPTFLPYS